MSAQPPLSDAARTQNQAADPRFSAWVSANAGAGKTRVLTDRVARLLLAGTAPERILCLTFTKAAAAEMQTRLFARLGGWAMLPDAELAQALAALEDDGATAGAEGLQRARRLFARALETPGGLKIQTIHAFCDAILRRFPVEAGVPPRFRVLDDRAALHLRATLLDTMAGEAPESFDLLARLTGGEPPGNTIGEILAQRARFGAPPAEVPMPSPEAQLAAILAEVTAADLARLIETITTGGKTEAQAAEALRAAAAHPSQEAIAALEAALLTKDLKPPARGLPTKGTLTALPEAGAMIASLQEAVLQAREARLAAIAAARGRDLHRFADAFLDRYEAEKLRQGSLDFDDLIERVRSLLTQAEMAAWVLYKLDGGIDHILVDEAQDTSPRQWDVIRAIADEFHAGADNRHRTIFVVGDEKQSIYSFQGAEPRAFGAMREHFEAQLRDADIGLADRRLIYSFRSARPILELVDQVIDTAGMPVETRHEAFHADQPGRVELWPYLRAPDKAEEQPWYLPLDQPSPEQPELRLARLIAVEVAGWLHSGRVLPTRDGPRPMRPGDVLILVRRRGPLFHTLIKELKSRGVPVSGADRLLLGEELVVKDLLAALRFASTPEDDLSLAALLRSPLFGLSEAELFGLAHGREGTLWQSVRKDGQPVVVEALSDLLRQADFLRPYEMLERILTLQDGRRRLRARLGDEVEDAIDALLAEALRFEAGEPPTLTGFLAWMDESDVELKRDLDHGSGSGPGVVRVMTIHGAKGLEAPVVILPDTAPRGRSGRTPSLLKVGADDVAWRMVKAEQPEAQRRAEEAAIAAEEAEARRLLYVALTRAESWLIIAGGGSEKGIETSWYGLVAEAMQACGPTPGPAPEMLEGKSQLLLHYWEEAQEAAASTAAPADTLPSWAHDPPPAPRAAPTTAAPSDLGGAHALPSAEGDEGEVARRRGELIHQLLEVLPAVPADARARVAATLLREDDGDLLREAEQVLSHPDLTHVFAEDTLAEVDIAALIAVLGRSIRGRIDRLILAPDTVTAVDFKSNRAVPERPDAVPEGLLRQMGAYRAALAALYPGRRAEVALLWTATAALMPLPASLVDAALARAAAELQTALDPAAALP
ncbi:MAG: double-strand break repair helicase AddA [Pseudomonadota bacterium]